ncbi:hypothetical protein DBR24_10815 [Pseudomonas sp. HMWF006]|nr:hypothetical protein DBR24_10815 [Pseudomonas sp. HMWF006]PTT62045.1 hypothetical protein DBR26_25400 [Pseudomonas sp. HMWF007]PTT94622.1 hypothetical protein DBR29_03045 [Pseudomonas sp. HMWF005]
MQAWIYASSLRHAREFQLGSDDGRENRRLRDASDELVDALERASEGGSLSRLNAKNSSGQ